MKPKKWLMSVFGLKESQEEEHKSDPTHTMIIAQGLYISGRIIGNDSIHVDGHLQGEIKVNNIVLIGKSGEVHGNIKAQKVIINGKFNGDITADSVEILEFGHVEGRIQTNKILIKGYYRGDIAGGGLFVDTNGEVYSNAQIKKIVAAGLLDGNFACKELRTLPTAVLRGRMFADMIQNEGGRIEGFIGKYSDIAKTNPEMAYYHRLFSSRNDYILLEANEYYVDIEEETKKESEEKEGGVVETDVVGESKKEK